MRERKSEKERERGIEKESAMNHVGSRKYPEGSELGYLTCSQRVLM
jgi:hypothetical protein